MDIQQIIDQVSAAVADAPEKISEIAADPKAAIEGIIGQPIEDIDPAEVLEGVKEKVQDIDFSQIAENLPSEAASIADQAKGFINHILGK